MTERGRERVSRVHFDEDETTYTLRVDRGHKRGQQDVFW